VTHVSIRLEKGGAPTLGYPAVREAVLARHGPAATLRQVADTVVSIRRTKSMVVDESDVCSRSAGSFFLNPIVDRPALERTRARAALHDLDPKRMPVRDAGPERWKLSSAWLIEQSGFPKGFRMGNAAVSPKHPLALVNAGGATAEEVVRLARTIRAGVQRKFEIDLSPEPVFVGWNDDPLRAGADA
jgi:UDP-N-acetylmuramate dehydrogenase